MATTVQEVTRQFSDTALRFNQILNNSDPNIKRSASSTSSGASSGVSSGVHASGTSSNTHDVVPVICDVSSNLEQIPTLFELPPGWVEDRFRVDRKRLEQLIIQ